MRPELFGDRVGLGGGELGHVAPLGAAIGKGASDVEVEVRHGLMSRDAVVLPHGDTAGIECANDGCGRPDDVAHDSGLFAAVQFENGLTVLDRNDEEMAATALLVGDQHGAGVVPIKDCVGHVARRGTRSMNMARRREHEGHRESSLITVVKLAFGELGRSARFDEGTVSLLGTWTEVQSRLPICATRRRMPARR